MAAPVAAHADLLDHLEAIGLAEFVHAAARDHLVIHGGVGREAGLAGVLQLPRPAVIEHMQEMRRMPRQEALHAVLVGHADDHDAAGLEPADEVVEHLARAFHMLEHEGVVDDVEALGWQFDGAQVAHHAMLQVLHLHAPRLQRLGIHVDAGQLVVHAIHAEVPLAAAAGLQHLEHLAGLPLGAQPFLEQLQLRLILRNDLHRSVLHRATPATAAGGAAGASVWRYQSTVDAMPLRRSMRGRHPSAARRDTSSSLRGVPSGRLVSKRRRP